MNIPTKLKEVAEQTWFKSVFAPLLVALIAFAVAYGVHLRPMMLKGQVEFQMTNLINNIERVQEHLDELESQDKPVADERVKLDQIKEHKKDADTEYDKGEFKDALGDIDEGDDLGREHFSDLWIRYPPSDLGDST